MDTAPCKNIEKLSKNADLLITESTWTSELHNLVEKRKHLTSKLAAELAKKYNVNALILTHFSQRYKEIKHIEKEAQKYFKNTRAAEDFMEIEI